MSKSPSEITEIHILLQQLKAQLLKNEFSESNKEAALHDMLKINKLLSALIEKSSNDELTDYLAEIHTEIQFLQNIAYQRKSDIALSVLKIQRASKGVSKYRSI